jgi:hypothetical protein
MAPESRRALLEKLPESEMVYPEALSHRIKYYLWYYLGAYHPALRDSATYLRIIANRGRQPYLLGKIAPQYSTEEFVSHLVSKSYAYHRIAWVDEGEVVSLRYVENFTHQYHVRVFEDREVHAHYEYTPECYPILHMWDIGREERREEFMKQFGDYLTEHTSADRSDYEWEILPLKKYLWE